MEEQDLGSLGQSPNTLSPEQEAEYRKLSLQMLDAFGDKLFDLLLNALGGYGRLLNTAADGIWLGMRHEVKKFPPELLMMLKPYSGTRRIQRFVLAIAPHFLMQAPIENVERTLSELQPFLQKMEEIKRM